MRHWSGPRFAVSTAWRTALFVALGISVPLITYEIVTRSGCKAEGAARCIAVATAAQSALPPAMVVLFILLMIGPPIRRMRSLGRSRLFGLLVPLLLFADWPFLLVVGAQLRAGASISILWTQKIPFFILAALIVIALMVTRSPQDEARKPLGGLVGGLTLLAATGAALLGVLKGLLGLTFLAGSLPELRAIPVLVPLAEGLAFAACAGMVLLIVSELTRRPARINAGGVPRPSG